MSQLPADPPTPEPATLAFWGATQRNQLVLCRCGSCGLTFYYPRGFCPDCHAEVIETVAARGTGHVYACTTVMRAAGAWADAVPYVIAYVELDEGPRILTNIIDCDPHAVMVGQRVRLVFDPAGEYQLPRFTPDCDVRP